jgi:hypothetical protein
VEKRLINQNEFGKRENMTENEAVHEYMKGDFEFVWKELTGSKDDTRVSMKEMTRRAYEEGFKHGMRYEIRKVSGKIDDLIEKVITGEIE